MGETILNFLIIGVGHIVVFGAMALGAGYIAFRIMSYVFVLSRIRMLEKAVMEGLKLEWRDETGKYEKEREHFPDVPVKLKRRSK